jgi:prophage DNA circulation protein
LQAPQRAGARAERPGLANEAHTALEGPRPDVVEGLQAPTQRLPSLVLAWRRYGNSARSEKLLARNELPYPGFVPGGRALMILSEA